MDLHPIIVHFPIAFLVTYCGLEIISIPYLRRKEWFFPLKAFLLIAGALALPLAVMTGDEAADAFGETPLVEMHEEFAQATLVFFIIIAAVYLIAVTERTGWIAFPESVRKILQFIISPWIMVPLAIVGGILITLTGMLGGAIVYGTTADPLAAPVLALLGL